MESEAPAFVYDALPPLSLSDWNQSPATHDESHNYSVYRNEISDLTVDTAPVESDTVDFFSLDVDAGEKENGEEFVTPVVASKKSRKRRKDKEAEEPRLETNWFNENSCSKIPMLQLHKEIVDFSEFLLPTLDEKAQRDAAMDSVRSVIQYIWPDCKVEVFGSYKTGLYLPTSDIDVVILESGITNPQLGLKALSRALSQRGIAKNILVIAKARVPIIKFVEKKSSISFDLSFDMENGPKAAEFIQDAVVKLPPLRPLCLILKVFLQQRELNEVYSGGIGSYALLAMLIAFLKYLKDGRSPPEHNLGVLLVKFFDFYGRKLNTADVGVSCRKGGSFFSKSNKGFLNPARPGLISIEDPQTPENDIGKSSFNYFQIRSAFSMALSTLTNTKAILALGPNRSILGTIIRPDRILLERKGGKNGDVTFNSLLPGAGEPLPMSANGKSNGGLFCNWQLEEDEEGSFPRGDAVNGDNTPVLVDTPGKVTTKESSRRKKSKSKKKKMVDDDDGEEEEPSSKKRRRKNNELFTCVCTLLANTLYTLHSLDNSLSVHAMFTLLLPTLEFNSTESLYKRLQYSASSSARERSVMSHHTAHPIRIAFRIPNGWVEITHRRFREMGRDRDESPPEKAKGDVEDKDYRRNSSRSRIEKKSVEEEEEDVSRRESKRKSKEARDSDSGSGLESGSDSESDKEERRRSRKSRGKRKSDRRSRSRRSRRRHDDSSSSSESESESEYSDSESESEDERRRRKMKRREREERERKKRKEKKKRRMEKGVDGDSKKKKKRRKKEKKSEKAKKGAVTESWGKYGVIRETDMWNKRPEFTAWLLEVKEVNLESLPPWEEKKMFKDFMEDHNTGTFTSKKYYDIDGYYRRKLEKEMKKGLKKAGKSERTVFNDEEQRRLEMQEAREKQKEEEVLALKRSMEGGMAQAMKEQARLKEEMVYLYKIGDMEGAAAIQRRLDPDVPM
ncbi:hypothetical protein HID58_038219 [Brassica napus]|uniref:Uncharacterized protein n=2 Tax=Brassica TaxID=3705 RepID=A0ABQ8BNP0_BRANA|nr:hypothetical protein HID58_038219 [Brassica napus]